MTKIKFVNFVLWFTVDICSFGYILPKLLTEWLPLLMININKIPERLIILQWVCRINVYVGVSCIVAYLILWNILIIIGFIGLLLGLDNKKQK